MCVYAAKFNCHILPCDRFAAQIGPTLTTGQFVFPLDDAVVVGSNSSSNNHVTTNTQSATPSNAVSTSGAGALITLTFCVFANF
jgi:hypothetical protein